ncbi:MAG: L-ribulose-5-phosphate 4-epimerase AraD [Vicinamibacterales bacterium]
MRSIEEIREEVFEANLYLVRSGLVTFSFGNVSAIDRSRGLVVIKPSGVAYERLGAGDMVVTDLDGKTLGGGSLRPSTDLPTHLALYRAFPDVGGVAHTHSRYATAWAQARRPIPCLGTTHADHFRGEVPLTDPLADEEIESAYEFNTGLAIARRFTSLDPLATPGALVVGHGPFCWGHSATAAAETSAALEEIARLAYLTIGLDPSAGPIPLALSEKHFLRKHGPAAYYGQRRTEPEKD